MTDTHAADAIGFMIAGLYDARKLAKLKRRIEARFDRCCHIGRRISNRPGVYERALWLTMNSTYGKFAMPQMPPVHGRFNCAGRYIHPKD